MTVSSVINTGVSGIQSGMQQLNRAAEDTARLNGAGEQNVTGPLAEQVVARRSVESNARVVQTAYGTLGTLIDMKV